MFDFDEVIDRKAEGSVKWDFEDGDVIGMGNADMDFRSPDNVVDALVKCAEHGRYGYMKRGDDYFDSIISWYKRRFNWDIEKEWISGARGVWACTRICLGIYTKPGDSVLIQEPVFRPIPRIIKDVGCKMVSNPLKLVGDRYEIDFDDFEKKIKEHRPSVFFLVNPQNPTGRDYTLSELIRISEICNKYGVLVISDEIHGNISLDEHRHIPMPTVSSDAFSNTVLINGPSKGYNLMGLSNCVVIIPNKELRDKYLFAMSVYNWDFGVNVFAMAGIKAAFSEDADEWAAELKDYIQGNLDYMCEYFKRNIPQIRIIRPEASFLVWMDCRDLKMSPEEMDELFLKKAKVSLSPGEAYGAEGNGFRRMNIACPRIILKEACERIRVALCEK